MKIKYLDGTSWDWLDQFQATQHSVETPRSGLLVAIYDTTIKYPLKMDDGSEAILFDEGYCCLSYLPRKAHWCLHAIYDRNQNMVEWYFDIIKDQGQDEKGRTYYYDLYLDVVVRPDFTTLLLDEDELEEALKQGTLTKSDVQLAYDTSEEILRMVREDRTDLMDFLQEELETIK